jgi:hypothetical protein
MPPPSPSPTSQVVDAPWSSLIPDDQWKVFVSAIDAVRDAGVPALIGGAMALAGYTGRWRNTKDIDLIVRRDDHERAVAALKVAGFDDYFAQCPYDPTWIFRGYRDGVINDIIWELPNHRVVIDDAWFERATSLRLRDTVYPIVPAEELIRVKLYVMQRERCDWVDVLNVIAGALDRVDWTWLVRRMGRDLPLLQGVLAIFSWMCPARARQLPEWLRAQFALTIPSYDDADADEAQRVRLFDSRPWFAPHQPTDRPLER